LKTLNPRLNPAAAFKKGDLMQYVIIGNGIAGVCAAEAIRELDKAGGIVMVSDEVVTPYSRPMISMVLDGSVSYEKLPIRPADFYDQLDITPELGHRVSDIDVDGKRIRVKGDRWIPYDKLLIASGADARLLKVDGVGLENIFYMRTQADVQANLAAIPQAKQALVLGGGLVGFKAAYGLLKQGLDVTMLITSGYPLSMQVDEVAGKMIRDELLKFGLKVRVGISVEAFEGNGAVSGAHLSDGTRVACDMVVIGKGVLPALSFIPRDRIEVDLGIVVDDYLETTAADIFAAGDVAESIDIARKTRWVNAIWPEAAAQGRIAGMNMAGRRVSYKGSLSRNTMRILNLDVATFGMVNPPDDEAHETLSATDPGRSTYRKMVFRNESLVGAVLINQIEQAGLLMSLIQQEIPVKIDRRRLLSPRFNFGQLLA
jgi:NAD(P)H-nitrite reductase large subunit